MTDLTDDDLMALFLGGDIEAFDVLYIRYQRLIYNFAHLMLSDRASAQDVLQETFLTVTRVVDRYEARGQFRAWLLRICRNRCLNLLDARRRRRELAAELDMEIIDGPVSTPSPMAIMQSRELAEQLRQAIAELPESQREVLVLHTCQGLKYREVAEVLQLPINTVKTLLRRGRANLAKRLDTYAKTLGGS